MSSSEYDSCDEEEVSTIDLINENEIQSINRKDYKLIISKNLRNFVYNIETFSNNNPINVYHVSNLKKHLIVELS